MQYVSKDGGKPMPCVDVRYALSLGYELCDPQILSPQVEVAPAPPPSFPAQKAEDMNSDADQAVPPVQKKKKSRITYK